MKNQAKIDTKQPHTDYPYPTRNDQYFYIAKKTPTKVPQLKTTDTAKPSKTSQALRTTK